MSKKEQKAFRDRGAKLQENYGKIEIS